MREAVCSLMDEEGIWMRRRWMLGIVAAVCLLAAAACSAPDSGTDNGEEGEEKLPLEELLVPNGKEAFDRGFLDINGALFLEPTDLLAGARDFLTPGRYFDLLGEAEEVIYLPEGNRNYLSYYTYSLENRPVVLRFAGGNELAGALEGTLWEDLLWVGGFRLTGTPEVSVCGIRVGDSLETVLNTFRMDTPRQGSSYNGETVWWLYDDREDIYRYGYLVMDGEQPDYVCYVDSGGLVFDLNEAGEVEEIRFTADIETAEWYAPPDDLYPYAADISGTTCPGNLQTDCLRPCYDASGKYAVAGYGVYQLSYLLPELGPGETYSYDYTAMMQDAAFIISAWEAVETVRFSFQSPIWGYEYLVDITAEMVDEALGTPLDTFRAAWRDEVQQGGAADFSAFDEAVRAIRWAPELRTGTSYEEIRDGAPDLLADNSRPLVEELRINGEYFNLRMLQENTVSAWLGLPTSVKEIPTYEGAEVYRVVTYEGGVILGGWTPGGYTEQIETAGALYVDGTAPVNVNGIQVGDSAEKVIRSFAVQGAYETALPGYGVGEAVVLYGDVGHMGQYGYAAMEDGKLTQIVYGAGDNGVVTYFLDENETVSAIRCQLEGDMVLPIEP